MYNNTWWNWIADYLLLFTGLSTELRPVPAVFSIWLWYDPSWNMGAPIGTLSITPLPTALNHVKGLPVGLSSSHWKHLMKIFFSSPTFLYCPNVVDIASLCHLFKIVHNLYSSPNPFNPHPRPNLWNLSSNALDSPFCVWPCPKDHFIHTPLRFGTTSQWKLSSASLCLPSRRLFITILCHHCLFHLVLFGPV